jgi:hypothetical protein
MHDNAAAASLPRVPQRRLIAGAALVLAIAVAGLFYVKWAPYYAKSFVAAAHHSIGASIVSGKAAAPPPPSIATALNYAKAYYLAIWQALLLGLVLGAAVQVFFPRRWMYRFLGGLGLRSTVLGGIFSLAGMM